MEQEDKKSLKQKMKILKNGLRGEMEERKKVEDQLKLALNEV